jgi:hypothetical protein
VEFQSSLGRRAKCAWRSCCKLRGSQLAKLLPLVLIGCLHPQYRVLRRVHLVTKMDGIGLYQRTLGVAEIAKGQPATTDDALVQMGVPWIMGAQTRGGWQPKAAMCSLLHKQPGSGSLQECVTLSGMLSISVLSSRLHYPTRSNAVMVPVRFARRPPPSMG